MEEIDEINDTCFLAQDLHIDDEPSQQQINAKAIDMGMDLTKDLQYLYLARECLTAPLPKYWKPVQNSKGQSYYVDLLKGIGYTDHPVDMHYQRLYERAKNIGRGRRFQQFKLEDISPKLPQMVKLKQQQLNISAQLNTISEAPTERNDSDHKSQERGFIFQMDDELKQLPQRSEADNKKFLMEQRAIIQQQEQQNLQHRLQTQLGKLEVKFRQQIEQSLNARRMELISDINCHRMECEEELELRKDEITKKQQQAQGIYQRKKKTYLTRIDSQWSKHVEAQLKQKIELMRVTTQNRISKKQLQLQRLSNNRVTEQQQREKLNQIYKQLTRVQKRKRLSMCHLQYTKRFVRKTSNISSRYRTDSQGQMYTFDNKENIHENCLEHLKKQVRKSTAMDTYDGLTRKYFDKQRWSALDHADKNVMKSLNQQWDTLEKMRTLIGQEHYLQAKQLQKTVGRGPGRIFGRRAPAANNLLKSTDEFTLKLPPPISHKPRLFLKLYKKII